MNTHKPHLRHCMPRYINNHQKNKVSITLRCQICSTQNELISVIKVASTDIIISVRI